MKPLFHPFLRLSGPVSRLALLTALAVWTAAARPAMGQATGTVFGEIRDAETGEVLPGATIMVKDSPIGAAADVDGRYTLRRVPAGDLVLVASYLGYATQEIAVTLAAEERLEVNVSLEITFIEGMELVVQAQQRGQSRALTIQRKSPNIRAVVSSEQLDQFVDGTVSGALQRIAGMGHGGTNIRGVGAGSAKITMDGQRMGSTGADRSVDVSTLSADMVDQIEVIKVITPDMDADALSGTININTRRPIGGQRTMNVRLGGGLNSNFPNRSGLGSRFSFSFGDSPNERFSYGVNVSLLRSTDASQHVRTDWDWSNFEEIDGPSDILTGLRNGVRFDPRSRLNAGAQFTFQSSKRTTFYVMLNVNHEQRRRELHEVQWSFSQYLTPFETRGIDDPGRAGDMAYEGNLDDTETDQYTATLGARHLFDRFELEYKLGWGYGKSDVDRFQPVYTTLKAFENRITYDQGKHFPIVEILPTSYIKEFPEKQDFFNRTDEEVGWEFHRNDDFTAKIDFKVPIRRGSLKFGASGLLAMSDGTSERFLLRYQRQLFLTNYDDALGEEYQVFGRSHSTYRLPFLIDLERMREFSRTYRPHYDMDLEAWALTNAISYYDSREYTLGAYGMGTLELGPLRLLGGLRIEHTDSRYDGRAATINEEKKFRGAVDTLGANRYVHLFPNAQAIVSVGDMTNLRFAYSRSIGRPTLRQLSPNVLWDYSSKEITEGNPKLDPMISNNLDFLFEHYFTSVGQLSAGVFYKFLRDFIFDYTELIPPDGIDGQGTYGRWRRSTLLNAEKADVYGIELAWQQNLTFLPGLLGNLGIYSNYSYTKSLADIRRPEGKVRLQGQRPHVVNAGLSYTQSKFNGQVSYAWGTPSITSYGNLDFVPSIYGDSQRVYMDRYRAAANNLSLSLQYRLTDAFRLWFEADNLLNRTNIDYVYDLDAYPNTQTLAGRTLNAGLRYTF